MDLSRHLILLNGQPKTMQIDIIKKKMSNGYLVRFKNNPKSYNYSCNNVVWLSNPRWIDPLFAKVFVSGKEEKEVREIWEFMSGSLIYWRIVFRNGYVIEGCQEKISIVTSCLTEEKAIDVFTYLKNVAAINPLGKEEEENGILSQIYESINFVDSGSAASCYLNPETHPLLQLNHGDLIYPFGCNVSQKKAVKNAFESQMSVVQGPPGTGKTQTILNIIANIVCQGKTVLVVSNNNSATANIQEKLEKYGLSFIVAPLGSKANKEAFIEHQSVVPDECATWSIGMTDKMHMRKQLHAVLDQLDRVYVLQNEKAKLLQEQQAVILEWKHFCMITGVVEQQSFRRFPSSRIIKLWLDYQEMVKEESSMPKSWFVKFKERLKKWRLKWICKHRLDIIGIFEDMSKTALHIKEFQILYYLNRKEEIACRIIEIERELEQYDSKVMTEKMVELSMGLFKASLCERYHKQVRPVFTDTIDLKRNGEKFAKQYPVVLSTTFSARSCMIADKLFDYVIMDEASQVSIDTGALALTCAYNAVVVGDVLQLPNVITDEDKTKLEAIMSQYHIAEGYDCGKNSFLQSVLDVMKGVPETLLREHYRCHPRIINFCNQKFYGGNLLIMTEDKEEDNVLCAIRTVKGNHAINQYNQREIDVVRDEVLPVLKKYDSIGIITPYNNQVNAFKKQLEGVEVATIHKYQGREKDAIIMSVVDNQITPFADDANMLNVAVSRAKKKFCLVVTGNEQEQHGNVMDLIDYIAYNNCMVTESKLASIFDYLYEQYTEQRMAFLANYPQVSEYVSETLTYSLLQETLASDRRFCNLKVLCHIPLRQVVKETSFMTIEERKYASNYSTHLDFLIINAVSKQSVLAIETDGYSYHNEKSEQYQRDLMKNHILSTYGLPLLRLSTKGSNEKEKVLDKLNEIVVKAKS